MTLVGNPLRIYGITKMNTVRLKEYIGELCTGYNEGHKLFLFLDSSLSNDENIQVDMNGVKFTSLSFFNGAIGELVIKYPITFLKKHLDFINMASGDQLLLSKSIAFANKVKKNPSVGTSKNKKVNSI